MESLVSSEEGQFQPYNLQSQMQISEIRKCVENKDYSKASRLIQKLSLVALEKPETQILICEVYEANGDYPKALKCLHQACDQMEENNPLLFDIYKAMGNLYLKCGDIDAAEEKYNLANGINSEDESLIVNYGVLAIQQGDFNKAKERFAHAIEKNSQSDVSWVGLALVHRSFADQDLSRACLLRALDENPMNKIAVANLYEWSVQDGVDMSQEYIQNYIKTHPNDAEMQKIALSQRQ